MASIGCFSAHASFFHKDEMREILAAIKGKTDAGMPPQQAKLAAVEEALAQAIAERREIVDAVLKTKEGGHLAEKEKAAAEERKASRELERQRLVLEARKALDERERADRERELAERVAAEAAREKALSRAGDAQKELEAIGEKARARMRNADPAILAERPVAADWMTPEEKARAARLQAQVDAVPVTARAAPARAPGSSFLMAVRAAGGISPAFAEEIGSDTAMQLNRRLPGLMKKGGLSEDGLLEWAQQHGYLTDAEIAEADRNSTGGAHGLAKDMVRRAIGGEDVLPHGDREAHYASQEAARADIEEQYHQHRLLTDPEYAQASAAADLAVDEVGGDWSTMTEDEKNAELDALFGPQKARGPAENPAGAGEAAGARTDEEAAGQEVPAERQPGEDDDLARPALALQAQSEADLAAKEKQAAEGTVEEKTAAVRDRNEALLSPPEGTAPPRDAGEQKVPTQQEGLFGNKVETRKSAYNPAQLDILYEHADLRPGTTDEQKSLGIAALKGLFYRDRRAGATLLGSALWKDFTEHRGADLLGQRVETPEDLAKLAQILRDPRFETLRVFFSKGGEIVGHSGITSRMPGEVAFARGKTAQEGEADFHWRIRDLAKMKERLGADGYWLLHNHPSGRGHASDADHAITKKITSYFGGFLGHVIIDHNEYGFINAQGAESMHRLGFETRKSPEMVHDALGKRIASPGDFAEVAVGLQAKTGYDVLVSVSANGTVSALAEVPHGLLAASSRLEGLRATARVRRFGRMTSGNRVFIVSDSPNVLRGLVSNGAATDVISSGGHADTSLASRGVPVDGGSKYKSGTLTARQEAMFSRAATKTEAFKRWFGDSKAVDAKGEPLVVYHGAKRLDRMGPVIYKNRATSGPLPFFTDDKAIASNYASSKSDTSLPDEDRDYNAWFRLKVPGARNAVNIDRAWWHLSQEQRDKISALAPRVGNSDDGEQHVIHPEGWTRGLGGYDQHIKEARGNHLRALVEEWLNSAALYDREEEFQEILKLAGVDTSKVEMHSPWAEYPGVMPVYLSIQNPLRTDNISDAVVAALQKRANRQGRPAGIGADIWAKETRDARGWMEALRQDLAEQKNSHAWTSIPDWVTDTLKSLGYDGIIDRGGKMGGQEHGVYIPFESTQIKSAIGNRGTFDATKKNILFSRAEESESLFTPDEIRAQLKPILLSWKNAPEVKVLNSMAEAPEAVKSLDEAQRSQGASGLPEAFIHKNVVYIVADGLKSPEAAVRALLHESFGHFGLRQMLGSRIDPVLDEVAKAMPLRMKAKAREYGFDLANVSQRRQAAEEVLAEIAQSRPQLGFVRKAIAAVRQFLRDIGVRLKLSDADILANYILPARRLVEEGATESVPSAAEHAEAKRNLAEAKRIHKANPDYKPKAASELISRLEGRVTAGEAAFSRQRMAEAINEVRESGLRSLAAKVVDRLDQALNPLGTLPEQEKLLARRYLAQGEIEKVNDAAKAIAEAFPVASTPDQQAIFDYLTTAGSRPDAIADPVARHKAEQVKADINHVGDMLVAKGLLSEESREQYRDAYLPRLYLKHLLSEQDWKALGAGKKPSDMGYLKARKDIPEDVRKVILGEIEDPGFLAAMAVAKPMRDMALLDYLSDISANERWVMPGTVVDYTSPLTGNTHRATPFWLKTEAARLRKQSRLYEPAEAAKAEREAKAMDEAADDSLEGVQGTHEDYKQIPNTARYGRLRGLLVRREIYDDLMGVQDFLPTDPGWFQNIFGYGGAGTKATQIWKAMKVSMNPPAQIRNFVSNGVQLQLSGVPLRMVPARVMQAMREIQGDGRYFQIAKKYGIGSSTFATQEIYRMKTELIDLEMKTRGMGALGRLHRLAGLVMNKASDFYQVSETIFKTAKIIDAMEREGLSEEKAVLEANKWLFDYSLVQKSVRYARNAPIGVPFLTFSMKVLPRLMEVALLHPQRLIPWVALFYGFPMMVASMLGVDKDDTDKLKKALPQWLQDKGHAMILPWKDEQGRWQVADLGYFMPWTNWTELAGNVASGELGKAIQGAGLFGGPLTDLIIAIKTGKDPFSGRDIIAKGDPPERQAEALVNYVWDMAMPPIVTDHGLLSPMGALDKAYGGKLVQALTGTTSKWGEPRSSLTQAALYAAGINVSALTPEYTRATNIQAMTRDLQDVKTQLVHKLQDRSLTDAERREIATEYAGELIRRTEKLQRYMKDSAIAPALAAAH